MSERSRNVSHESRSSKLCAISSTHATCEYKVNHPGHPKSSFSLHPLNPSPTCQNHTLHAKSLFADPPVHVSSVPLSSPCTRSIWTLQKKDLILPQSICPHKKGLNLFLQIHPIPYHQSPLTMLLREALSVERRRQTKVTFFRQLLIVVYNWLFYSPLQIFKNKTCTDLAPGKRLSLRRRSSQFHGNTRVSDFHSSTRIFLHWALALIFWTLPILCKNGPRFLFSEENF